MADRFWELMARYWSGEITEQEKAELEQHLLEHPEYWLKAGLSRQLTYRAEPLLSAGDAERIADDVQEKLRGELEPSAPAPLRSRGSGWRRAGAWFLLTALIAGFLVFVAYRYLAPGAVNWKEAATIPGTKLSITLADGTTIRLNAGSKLRYPETFRPQDRQREVFLEGEAYFDVRQQEHKPFVIHAGGMDINVLGTELNVRAYADESFSETALLRGAVKVAIPGRDSLHTFYLVPGQKVVVVKDDKDAALQKKGPVTVTGIRKEQIALLPVRQVNDSTIAETAWKEDRLVFQDETLAELALRLERWYGVKIEIRDPGLAAKRFTGRADNVSLIQLLNILRTIVPFEFAIDQGKVVIQ